MATSTIVIALVIIFFAMLVKSVLGFGETLLAIPLLTIVMSIQTAVPLMALLAGTLTLMLIVKNWEHIDLKATRQLTLSAVVGIPIGTSALKFQSVELVTPALGITLVLIGIYFLVQPSLGGLRDGSRWSYVFGFTSGMLGGAYNMASPPILVYGAARQWSPDRFRVTLQGFFIWTSAGIVTSQGIAGLWTVQVMQLFALSIPVMIVSFVIGGRLNQHLSSHAFSQILYVALIVLGIMLVV